MPVPTVVKPVSCPVSEHSPSSLSRLPPVDRITALLPRLLAAVMRRMFGKVMLPVTVLYARMPAMCFGQLVLERYAQAGLLLPLEIKQLIEQRVSASNACSFCADVNAAAVIFEGQVPLPLSTCLAGARDESIPEGMRAVMAYVDELARDHTVSSETFAALTQHYDDRQVAQIVWLTAFTHYHNLMARPLGFPSQGFSDLVDARRAG